MRLNGACSAIPCPIPICIAFLYRTRKIKSHTTGALAGYSRLDLKFSNNLCLADSSTAYAPLPATVSVTPCLQDTRSSCACNPAQADHAAANLRNCPEPGNECEAQRQHPSNGRQAAVSFLPVSVRVMLSCERMTYMPPSNPSHILSTAASSRTQRGWARHKTVWTTSSGACMPGPKPWP